MVPKMWDKPLCEGVWPYLDPWDSVRLLAILAQGSSKRGFACLLSVCCAFVLACFAVQRSLPLPAS